jgi:hypothetical protein
LLIYLKALIGYKLKYLFKTKSRKLKNKKDIKILSLSLVKMIRKPIKEDKVAKK